MRSVSVVIADRHPVVLYGLMSILRTEIDLRVVASCRDGRKCLQAIRELSPDIALLDILMPGLSGLEILAAATSEHLPTRFVFLTTHIEDRDLIIAAARGAYGMVLKDAAPEALVHGLRQVVAGRRLFPLTNSEFHHEEECPPHNATTENARIALTERERQIMHLVSEGWSNKEVGRQLSISDGTIKVHLHHIFRKLAISNRTALAALAFSHHDEHSLNDATPLPSV
jgi:two-component system nitrate/nitrite response regulator NarL